MEGRTASGDEPMSRMRATADDHGPLGSRVIGSPSGRARLVERVDPMTRRDPHRPRSRDQETRRPDCSSRDGRDRAVLHESEVEDVLARVDVAWQGRQIGTPLSVRVRERSTTWRPRGRAVRPPWGPASHIRRVTGPQDGDRGVRIALQGSDRSRQRSVGRHLDQSGDRVAVWRPVDARGGVAPPPPRRRMPHHPGAPPRHDGQRARAAVACARRAGDACRSAGCARLARTNRHRTRATRPVPR